MSIQRNWLYIDSICCNLTFDCRKRLSWGNRWFNFKTIINVPWMSIWICSNNRKCGIGTYRRSFSCL